jgi:hypothetical protein
VQSPEDQEQNGSQRRPALNWQASIAVAACIVSGTLFFEATNRGTVGLSKSRPDVMRAMLVFTGLDPVHRGSEVWAYVGLALTLVLLGFVGWGVAVALRGRVRR